MVEIAVAVGEAAKVLALEPVLVDCSMTHALAFEICLVYQMTENVIQCHL